MKNLKTLSILLIVSAVSSSAFAQKSSKALQSLGTQESLMEKAQPAVPANTYRVVQRRAINMDYVSEFSASAGAVNGGDSYYRSKTLGLQYDFHFNRWFSIGARHTFFYNDLTPEGKNRADIAQAADDVSFGAGYWPQMDYPISQTLGTINFYPLYGKMSWFESTVSYFDFYVMAGGGTYRLRSGSTGVGTAGMGLGMWWTQNVSSRIEVRYQQYNDMLTWKDPRRVENTVAMFSMGFML